MEQPAQLLLGVLLLWLPGAALTWALAPSLDWAKFVATSVVVGLSVPPATIYVLNVFFGVPFNPVNIVLVAFFYALLGAAMGLRPRLDAAA